MDPAHTTPAQPFPNSPLSPIRNLFSASLRFWEPRRLLYNLALAIVVLLWVALTWPHFRPAFVLSTISPLFFLALVANVCYCAAYLVDIPMQLSSFHANWLHFRWILWILGTLFAILLANYWIADEIYAFVH